MDLRHGLTVALQNDGLPALLDGFHQLGKAGLGFMHVDGNHA
jgi:hypothetical protein